MKRLFLLLDIPFLHKPTPASLGKGYTWASSHTLCAGDLEGQLCMIFFHFHLTFIRGRGDPMGREDMPKWRWRFIFS